MNRDSTPNQAAVNQGARLTGQLLGDVLRVFMTEFLPKAGSSFAYSEVTQLIAATTMSAAMGLRMQSLKHLQINNVMTEMVDNKTRVPISQDLHELSNSFLPPEFRDQHEDDTIPVVKIIPEEHKTEGREMATGETSSHM